jgi:hypothetical protein
VRILEAIRKKLPDALPRPDLEMVAKEELVKDVISVKK